MIREFMKILRGVLVIRGMGFEIVKGGWLWSLFVVYFFLWICWLKVFWFNIGFFFVVVFNFYFSLVLELCSVALGLVGYGV